MWGGPHREVINLLATSVTSLTPHLSAIVACFDFLAGNLSPGVSDFCNKIGTELPIPNVRFHSESWRVSGRATEIVETTFMTPEPTLMALAER
jgi:hypothetical protein